MSRSAGGTCERGLTDRIGGEALSYRAAQPRGRGHQNRVKFGRSFRSCDDQREVPFPIGWVGCVAALSAAGRAKAKG